MADLIRADDTTDHFHLPLSVEAYDQLQELNALVTDTELDSMQDSWSYPWTKQEYQVA